MTGKTGRVAVRLLVEVGQTDKRGMIAMRDVSLVQIAKTLYLKLHFHLCIQY